jgi:hypothetical protein
VELSPNHCCYWIATIVLLYLCWPTYNCQQNETIECCHWNATMDFLAALSSYKIFHTTFKQIKAPRSASKVPDIFVRFLSKLGFLDRFSWKSIVSNFVKICPFGAALIHADGPTNRHDEVISRFSLYMRTCLIVSAFIRTQVRAVKLQLQVFHFIFPHSAVANTLQTALIYISHLKRV